MRGCFMTFILNLTRAVFIPLEFAWFIVQVIRPVSNLGSKIHLHPYLNLAVTMILLIAAGFFGVRFLARLAIEINTVYSRYASSLTQRYTDFMAIFNITPEMLASVQWGNLGLDFLRNYAGKITSFIVDMSNTFS